MQLIVFVWLRIANYNRISDLTALGQYWAGINVDLYISKEDFKKFNSEHFVCIMNHKYDIDWMIGWIICQRIGLLGVRFQN
jgi:lysophosphatidic acid acyltransferase/lysophosphatidylinositol acyltransferase